MNKETIMQFYREHEKTIDLINKALLFIGIILISLGVGAIYQAQQDVIALNQSLFNISQNGGILTDGTTYYFIGMYENRLEFSAMDLLNKTQCDALYYGGK